jgi:hypothetical protein
VSIRADRLPTAGRSSLPSACRPRRSDRAREYAVTDCLVPLGNVRAREITVPVYLQSCPLVVTKPRSASKDARAGIPNTTDSPLSADASLPTLAHGCSIMRKSAQAGSPLWWYLVFFATVWPHSRMKPPSEKIDCSSEASTLRLGEISSHSNRPPSTPESLPRGGSSRRHSSADNSGLC